MKTNTKIVLLTDQYEPTVSKDSIGTIVCINPFDDHFEVEFSDDRLLILSEKQFRVASQSEIDNDFGDVNDRT